MILFIEPNRKIRKRICDLLSRERIIAVGSYTETLEMIAKFQKRLNIIIANIRVLDEILNKQTLFRLCDKLAISVPPVLAIYRKGDDKVKEKFEEKYRNYKLLKYDGDDNSWPERYIAAVKKIYPEVIAELRKATESWLKGEPEIQVDTREWLIKEGFLDVIEGTKYGKMAKEMEHILPLVKKMLSTAEHDTTDDDKEKEKDKDYKKRYSEVKRKFDLLVKYIKELDARTKSH
jgi:hypothetical protein